MLGQYFVGCFNVFVSQVNSAASQQMIMGFKGLKMAFSRIFVLVLALFFPLFAFAQETVCAVVKIEIAQELTIERQAFEAKLRIENTLADKSIENIHVEVEFKDEFEQSVLATSDPNDTNAKFFIRVSTLQGITDISGNGSLAGGQVANATWLIIPAPGASEGLPSGKLHFVSATFSYLLDGVPGSIEVAPDSIYVKPLPLLTLDYFLPKDVFADNPLTQDIVEPPEPFSLGVRVTNNGNGLGQSIKIDSAQPEIVENEQDLLIDFTLLDSFVQNEAVNNSLLINFGDIPAGESKHGRWIMQTSLSGRFREFTAEYSHADELGGELTSLLEATNTHFLLRDVRVDITGRDDVKDFLAYDIADELSGTFEGLKVYESNSTTTPVSDLSHTASFVASVSNDVYDLRFTPGAGFVYVQLDDPFDGAKQIQRVIRRDGKDMDLSNVWFSKSYDRTTKTISHHINLFDASTAGEYQVFLEDPVILPRPPVLQFIPLRTTYETNSIGFLVEASDPDQTIPSLTASGLPEGAQFTDQGEGQAIFTWTPAVGQAGRHEFQVVASDGELATSRTVTIVVNPLTDTDGDGLLDSWEIEHFGDLSRDGTGDFDGDGISDFQEHENGTNPSIPDFAIMQTPTNGDTLNSRTVTFSWSDVDADAYRIDIGSTQGGKNFLSDFVVNDISAEIDNLPVDGRVFYVRLWTLVGEVQGYNDYAYTALLINQDKAGIIAPANDSELTSDEASFSWNDVGADQYQLDIGTSPGASDVFQQVTSDSSMLVSGLPLDGRQLYVRLWTIFEGESGYETYNDYIYTAHKKLIERAEMVIPVNGTALPDSEVTFEWTDVGAQEYYIEIGTRVGQSQLFSGSTGTDTQISISGLPINGVDIFVRLWTVSSDEISEFNDYVYTAHSVDMGQAAVTGPISGTELTSREVTITWEDVGADEYFLRVGSERGGYDIYYGAEGQATEKTLTKLPYDGRQVYVRILSKINGQWFFRDESFTAYHDETIASEILSPAPGSTFTSRTAEFVWNDAQAEAYFIKVGSEPGASDLFYANMEQETRKTISNLPFDGSPVYVRLLTKSYGVWYHYDYVYGAYHDEILAAEMLSPQPGSAFESTTVNFTWQDADADEYYLSIKSGDGSDLYYGSMGTETQKTVSNLPFDGRDINVTLYTKSYGSWRQNAYQYKAYTDPIIAAKMLSPSPDQHLTSTSATFTWEDAQADEYFLRIGTQPGGSEYFYGSMGVDTSYTVTGLPYEGQPLYVRLYTRDYGEWRYEDYVYTAYNDERIAARMLTPQPGDTFTGVDVEFTWEDAQADQYFIRVGSSLGDSDLFYAAFDTQTSVMVNKLPHDGRTVYVRLSTKDYGRWVHHDYVYNAFHDQTVSASLLTPVPDSTLTSTSAVFSWDDASADQYFLRIGSALGESDVAYGSFSNADPVTINNLPYDGRTLYVRLSTKKYGAWRHKEYTLNAYNDTLIAAEMIAPVQGETLGSGTVEFFWEDAEADEYYLSVGSEFNGYDIFALSMGTSTSQVLTNIPTDGRTIYVRLRTRDYGKWEDRHYTYTAADNQ